MNNTKANGLQNAHFSIISVPVLICAIKIRETALYILEGSIESNYSKDTAKSWLIIENSNSGHTFAINILKRALCRLLGSLYANDSNCAFHVSCVSLGDRYARRF